MIQMSTFKFNDYTDEVQGLLENLAVSVLEECGGELESQIKRNTPVGRVAGSGLKNSWTHNVKSENDVHTVTIGSTLERALWVEFGTGEYAIPESGKSGRKGGWYIPVGSGKGCISEAVAKAYGFTIRHGKDGRKWVFTLGMKPKRPVHKAYTSMKSKLIRRIQSQIAGGLK